VSGADEPSYQIARSAGMAAALVAGLALECWRPHARLRPAWSTNLGLWAVDAAAMGLVCGACGWAVAAWASERGLGILAWAGAGPWTAAVLGAVALDAVSYAWHRANHRVRPLWRFHRVHHGDVSFHVTTALRFHPGELLLALPVRLAAVVAFGVPPAGILAFELVFGFANVLEHGNFDLPRALDRALQRALVTPSLHRGHHAADWRELDTNFGTVFSVWDRLAGTFRVGEPERQLATGLPAWSGRDAPSLSESLLLPFAHRSERERASG
jgi:sterol desaturase/sphingolipid hydroxylase (fatty acid hydroxylase superfamily)